MRAAAATVLGGVATAVLIGILGALGPALPVRAEPPSDARRVALRARSAQPEEASRTRENAVVAERRLPNPSRAFRDAPPRPSSHALAAQRRAPARTAPTDHPAITAFGGTPRFAVSPRPEGVRSTAADFGTPPKAPEPETPSVLSPTASTGTADDSQHGPPAVGVTKAAIGRRMPKPAYPAEARAAGEEGSVDVRLAVDAEGRVVSATVVGSAASELLRRAAVRAALLWTFEPALRDGRAVPTSLVRRFVFRLQDEP